MAKSIIEKAPFSFHPTLYNIQESLDYLQKYQDTDSKGRYLYWDKLRYRIAQGDDAQKAWWATKFVRFSKSKPLEYYDKEGNMFLFCIPDTLQAKLYKISHLSSSGIVPNNSIKKHYLISSLIMEEAISSSQLEGASTTRRVAKDMLINNRKPKNSDEAMILNNYLLMREIKRLINEELTLDMILDLHRIATFGSDENGNIAGAFRQSDDIVISDGNDTILHQPPSHELIEKRLQAVCDFANTAHLGEEEIFIHPIIKATMLHFMIGYEHPFSDGNGRTARAIFYWFMLKSGFDYFEYISISKLLKEAPKQYGMSFYYSEIDDNDMTYFIDYQLDIILRAIDELLKYLEQKSRDFEEINTLLSNSPMGATLNFIQKDIIKKAIKNPGRTFNAKEVATDYDKSLNSARKYLNTLVEYKILAITQQGKTKEYIALSNIRRVLEK
ncbi:MAG: Fic family protein [Campylobacterales bacterium]|nr:Fic family protein [Campylobacterales bacterium]